MPSCAVYGCKKRSNTSSIQKDGLSFHRMRYYVRKTNRGKTPQQLMQSAAYAVMHQGQSLRTIAKALNICHATLFRFIKKLKSGDNPTVGYKPKLLFPAAQEQEIVNQLAQYAKVFCGLSIDEVRKLSFQIARRWKFVIPESWVKNGTASKDWADKFVKRHNFPVKPLKGKSFQYFYNILDKLMDKHKFLPSRIYYLEEITVPIAKYIPDTSLADLKPVCMELATNALGEIVTPMFMMNYQEYDLKDKSNICIESKTEITNATDSRYLNHFIDCTKPCVADPILLLIDNCQYIDMNVLKKAIRSSIILLCIPKSEGGMKPFVKLAKFIKKPGKGQKLLSKLDCDILDIIHVIMPSKKEIVKCFSENGVWPFNPSVVTGEEFVPEPVEEYNFKVFQMGRARKGVRKMGNHTEGDMRTALNLIKSGLSLRHASRQCHLSYATVRRYLVLMKKNEGKPIRLTPNYGVNRVFSVEEEDYLVKYIKKGKEKFKGLTTEGFSLRDCRRLAYETAKIINKKIPQAWVNAKMAGMEWLRSFRERHQLVFVNRKAGEIIRQTVFDNDDMEAFFGHLKIVKQETVNEPVAQPLPGPSRIPSIPTTQPSDTNVSSKDPLARATIEQCRFCGEFTKCVSISNKPHLNVTTLAFNDITIQLDFNDETLPNTVCQTCDAKLKEMYDFVKVVKAAQESLINVGEHRQVDVGIDATEDFETLVVKTEYDDDIAEKDDDDDDIAEKDDDDNDESKDGIVDSLTIGETIFIKENVTYKRKSKTASPKKLKKAKLTEVKSENEDAELIIDIKKEVIERDTNDLEGNTGGFVSDTGTDAKPSEVELATSALVFEMRSDGGGYGYS